MKNEANFLQKNISLENENYFSVKIPGKFARFSENIVDENREEIEIKSIISLVSEVPILSEYQITMILRLSMKYILPIHKALSIFLSEPTLRRLQKYNFPLENRENFSEKILQNSESEKNFFETENNFKNPENSEINKKLYIFSQKSLSDSV